MQRVGNKVYEGRCHRPALHGIRKGYPYHGWWHPRQRVYHVTCELLRESGDMFIHGRDTLYGNPVFQTGNPWARCGFTRMPYVS